MRLEETGRGLVRPSKPLIDAQAQGPHDRQHEQFSQQHDQPDKRDDRAGHAEGPGQIPHGRASRVG